uniref:Serpentine receptor class gamma n=1 Tax=Panagrellus redivivus TaxID=6233 RepID=A0A7E4VNR8_PANRE
MPAVIEPVEARPDQSDGVLRVVQKKIYAHYINLAYTLVIGTYFVAFGLYLYFRLTNLVFPDKIIYKRFCEQHENETVVRTGFHYASTLGAFCASEFIQIVCFFLLTISGNFLRIRRHYRYFISMEEKLLLELRYHIRKIMYSTVLQTFVVYIMSSIAVWASIFYMVGMRDEVMDATSAVFIHLFDAAVAIYFIAFPLISFVYHPDIRCSFQNCVSVPADPNETPRRYNAPFRGAQFPTSTSAVHLTAYKRADEDITEPMDLRVRITTTV